MQEVGDVASHSDVPHVRRVEGAPEDPDPPARLLLRRQESGPSVCSSAASGESG